jgi:peptidoglycan/xylan/chitin deacetylase (PgdA/CDA1 family)
MYHKVLKNRFGKYIVTPQQIEEDFQKYLALGYTPVFVREVVDFVDGKGTLPQKPMVITFDDGYYNNMHYVLPLCKKYNVKIVVSPVIKYMENTVREKDPNNLNYSYFTFEQIAEMEKSGFVEIGGHTYDMHSLSVGFGVNKKRRERIPDYRTALTSDIMKANERILSAGVRKPVTFAYPFGKYNSIAKDVLVEMGFRALLTCNEMVSKVEVGHPESLLSLGRYNRSGNINREAFCKKIFG